MLKCVNFTGINPIYNNYSPNSKTIRNWIVERDSFTRSNVNTVEKQENIEAKELDRLFPNGEFFSVYNRIVKDFGIEKPPKLRFIAGYRQRGNSAGYNHLYNDINITTDFLRPDARKFYYEKDGKGLYLGNVVRFLHYNNNAEEIKNEIDIAGKYGFKVTAVPLTDDDKKKMMIILIAHELAHAYQYQCIRHTEGLNEWNMTVSRNNKHLPPKVNLIENKLNMIKMKEFYDKQYTEKDFEKRYSQDSPEGKQALEWYNSDINYIHAEDNYDEYINNPLETNAVERSFNYLKDNFGYFEGVVV